MIGVIKRDRTENKFLLDYFWNMIFERAKIKEKIHSALGVGLLVAARFLVSFGLFLLRFFP
jgi:hypothetical protein